MYVLVGIATALAALAVGTFLENAVTTRLGLVLLILSCTSCLCVAARVAADRVIAVLQYRCRCPRCDGPLRTATPAQERVATLN